MYCNIPVFYLIFVVAVVIVITIIINNYNNNDDDDDDDSSFFVVSSTVEIVHGYFNIPAVIEKTRHSVCIPDAASIRGFTVRDQMCGLSHIHREGDRAGGERRECDRELK